MKPPSSLPQRIQAKVAVDSSCWQWKACILDTGYGQVRADGKSRLAHRVIYEALIGPIPSGLTIDHLCRNRSCVNPEHMEIVTQRTNTLRGVGASARNAIKSHCIHGHPFEAENLRIRPDGSRECRECANERNRRYRRERTKP